MTPERIREIEEQFALSQTHTSTSVNVKHLGLELIAEIRRLNEELEKAIREKINTETALLNFPTDMPTLCAVSFWSQRAKKAEAKLHELASREPKEIRGLGEK